ncbi:nucleoredoxin [Cyclospora cayetanensis]|uniref:Nucleoredoxin n=1 Tax=Cyclospora cayetanensis TaxID=88456 RepID=A0A6P6S1P9_9EIME|nr:nucleoredoxin [Cyclospora cayetanensis]
MPWHAVPYDDSEGRDRIRSLYKKFRVTSLPHIVLLDEHGRVSNPQAYTAMLANPLDFPWKRKNPIQLLGNKLVNNKGETLDPAELSGKTVGIYFSASWCPPCQRFTPKLVETVKRLKERGEQVEIVFVSNDRDEESFNKYFAKMDWLAVPFKEVSTRAVAQDALNVRSLPTLLWVSPSGEVLTRRGVAALLKDEEGSLFPWKEKAVKDLDEALDAVSEQPVLLAFLDAADEQTHQKVKEVLEETAAALEETEGGEALGPVPHFLTARKGSPSTTALRQICKEGLPAEGTGQQVSLLILDAFSQKVYGYPKAAEAVTKEDLLAFIRQFREDALEGKPIALPE